MLAMIMIFMKRVEQFSFEFRCSCQVWHFVYGSSICCYWVARKRDLVNDYKNNRRFGLLEYALIYCETVYETLVMDELRTYHNDKAMLPK